MLTFDQKQYKQSAAIKGEKAEGLKKIKSFHGKSGK